MERREAGTERKEKKNIKRKINILMNKNITYY